MLFVVLVFATSHVAGVMADITGTDPPEGSCLCFTANSVNVRSTPCGTVIGGANVGQCFRSKGQKETCILAGISYEFFLFNYGGVDGWAAGNFMNSSDDSECSTSTEGYTCQVMNQGQRIHETTSPTTFDCRDPGCSNTCQGGQCVAYVTCRCTREGHYIPDTSCWRPGTKIMMPDGRCNRNVPINTAIATFDSNGRYYAGHAAVFMGCQNDYTIRAYDQWCCRPIGYSTYTSGHSYFGTFAVITNPDICSDRTTWDCRTENAGATCCPTEVNGCMANKYWWKSFMNVNDNMHNE